VKPRKKKASGSLLSRFLKGGKKKGKAGARKTAKKKEAAPKAQPKTLLERSITEIKQMTTIGEKDPERLARLLTSILAKERTKQQAEQQRFEGMVWDIVHRSEQGGDDQAESEDQSRPNGQSPDEDPPLR